VKTTYLTDGQRRWNRKDRSRSGPFMISTIEVRPARSKGEDGRIGNDTRLEEAIVAIVGSNVDQLVAALVPQDSGECIGVEVQPQEMAGGMELLFPVQKGKGSFPIEL
jgi:hypothetical protein